MMQQKLWTATLDKKSPRYEIWNGILGGDDVHLLSPATTKGTLGAETVDVHLLDWNRLDLEQCVRLVIYVTRDIVSPKDAEDQRCILHNQLDEEGFFPIRAADVVVIYNVALFI